MMEVLQQVSYLHRCAFQQYCLYGAQRRPLIEHRNDADQEFVLQPHAPQQKPLALNHQVIHHLRIAL